MGQVTVTINDQNYPIACDNGQEEHLVGLAAEVNKRVNELRAAVGQVGEARLLVMTSLLLIDELLETRHQVEGLREALNRNEGIAQRLAEEEELAGLIETLAGRIEDIAQRLARS
ncbi:MAG: cell division protein ZapA [Proteobacteria bacterium]|nr:cell division protein ZapA [Pseudomonadota bacterium]